MSPSLSTPVLMDTGWFVKQVIPHSCSQTAVKKTQGDGRPTPHVSSFCWTSCLCSIAVCRPAQHHGATKSNKYQSVFLFHPHDGFIYHVVLAEDSTITIPAMGRRFTVTNCFPGRAADAFSCALPNILELSVCSHLSFYLRCLQPPIDNDVDNEVSFGVSQLAECLQDVFSAVTLKDCWVGMNLSDWFPH